MQSQSNLQNIILVVAVYEPIFKELDSPYQEICNPINGVYASGYSHFSSEMVGFASSTDAWSEVSVLFTEKYFFINKQQVGLNHYRRIFSLDPGEITLQHRTVDYRTRFKLAGTQAEFLPDYLGRVIIPSPVHANIAVDASLIAVDASLIAADASMSSLEGFLHSHGPLEEALNVACTAFNNSVQDIFGVVDSKHELAHTFHVHPWNMWIGSSEFYEEWTSILYPIFKSLDEISPSLPKSGYQNRWGGFIAERMFTVYINLCKDSGRWDFVERPVIFFEDTILAERDTILAERDTILAERDTILAERDTILAERDTILAERDKVAASLRNILTSKYRTATRFLHIGEKYLKEFFKS
jgi:hypothetical protein